MIGALYITGNSDKTIYDLTTKPIYMYIYIQIDGQFIVNKKCSRQLAELHCYLQRIIIFNYYNNITLFTSQIRIAINNESNV